MRQLFSRLWLYLSCSILLLMALYCWGLPSSNSSSSAHALPRRVLLQLHTLGSGPEAASRSGNRTAYADSSESISGKGSLKNAHSKLTDYTWRWDWESMLALALATANFAAAASTGQGGTAVLIPIFTSLLHIPVNAAVAVAIFVVWLGSVPSLCHAMVMPHPYRAATTLIDYSTMSILTPAMLVGIKAGVTLNKMSPDWFVSFLLILAYSLSTGKQLHSMIKVRMQEAAMAQIMKRVENEIAELERTGSAVLSAHPEGHSSKSNHIADTAGHGLIASQAEQAVLTEQEQQPELWQFASCPIEQQLNQQQEQVELQRRQTLCELQSDVQQLAHLTLEVMKAEALTLSPHSLDTSLSSNVIMSTMEHLLHQPQQQQQQQLRESASTLDRCSIVPHDCIVSLHNTVGAAASSGAVVEQDSTSKFGVLPRHSDAGVAGRTAAAAATYGQQLGCSSNRTIAGLTESQLLQFGQALARASNNAGFTPDTAHHQPAADCFEACLRPDSWQQRGSSSSSVNGGNCNVNPSVKLAGNITAAAAAAAAKGPGSGTPAPQPPAAAAAATAIATAAAAAKEAATQEAQGSQTQQQQQKHVLHMHSAAQQQQGILAPSLSGGKRGVLFWWSCLLTWWSQQPQVLLLLVSGNFIVYVVTSVIWSCLPPCHKGSYITSAVFIAAIGALAGYTCWLHWPASNSTWCCTVHRTGRRKQPQKGGRPAVDDAGCATSSAPCCAAVPEDSSTGKAAPGSPAPAHISPNRLEESAHIAAVPAKATAAAAAGTGGDQQLSSAPAAAVADPVAGQTGTSTAAAADASGITDGQFNDIEWTPKRLLYFQPLMLLIGVLSGLMGASPNTLFLTPMLLSMGQHPQVAAATLKLALFVSSGCSSVGFLLNGHLDVAHGLIFGAANLVTTPFGQLATDVWIRKTGCPSVILLINVVRNVLAIPLLVWFNGVPGVIDLVHGTDVHFETAHICQ